MSMDVSPHEFVSCVTHGRPTYAGAWCRLNFGEWCRVVFGRCQWKPGGSDVISGVSYPCGLQPSTRPPCPLDERCNGPLGVAPRVPCAAGDDDSGLGPEWIMSFGRGVQREGRITDPVLPL